MNTEPETPMQKSAKEAVVAAEKVKNAKLAEEREK